MLCGTEKFVLSIINQAIISTSRPGAFFQQILPKLLGNNYSGKIFIFIFQINASEDICVKMLKMYKLSLMVTRLRAM
jgi:hypothetical protein